jgi:hypothetical protein
MIDVFVYSKAIVKSQIGQYSSSAGARTTDLQRFEKKKTSSSITNLLAYALFSLL